MSHVPHELHDEFPGDTDILHRLKTEDTRFARLADQYHQLNRDIHRAETDVEPTSDARIEQMKKERLSLLDVIAAMLKEAKAGVRG